MTGYTVSEDTLRRFGTPGPRYTSYPTAVEFHEDVGEAMYREKLSEANAQRGDAPFSLYTHLPFCQHRCLFCGCHVVITDHMDVPEQYLEFLKREIDMVAGLLPNRRGVAQLQWGGGTPTYFAPRQLESLFRFITDRFTFRDDAEISVEVDPRVTTFEHLERLSQLGFNRLSMGVQDLTPEVQDAITRRQTFDQTLRMVEHAREVGFGEGINLDLIYGLPRQRLDTFDHNLSQVLSLRPDRVAVYSFAYVPWLKSHQRKIDRDELPSPDLKLKLYLRAMERFLDAGYQPIGMDHFALPDDELAVAAGEGRLHRNFMGYTVQPASDMLAFGISGIGDVQSGYFQNHKKLSRYYDAISNNRLPVQRGYLLDKDDEIRRYVITQLMCNCRVDKAAVAERFDIDFDAYFESALDRLDDLVDAGFVQRSASDVTVTEPGRLFIRNACMAFDRYLEAKREAKPVFSQTV